MNYFQRKSWSVYTVGIFIGLLSTVALWSADHLLGITTAFEYTSALGLNLISNPGSYYESNSPKINWEWMLVLGVFLGAFLSSKLSRDRNHPKVPRLWEKRFGNSIAKRYSLAFLGGLLMMYGARLAQGCTSGHGISGILQFAVASWIFVPIFCVTGFIVAKIIYRNV
jgi:uncharacterized protein